MFKKTAIAVNKSAPHLLCLAGCAAFTYGLWAWWPPLAPIIAGMLVTAFGAFWQLQRTKKDKPKQ